MTGDNFDTASDLNRPGVFRLNIGVSKTTYLSLFGSPSGRPGSNGVVETGHDFTAINQIMPHPIYAGMFWICVLSPSETTFEKVKPFLAEAYTRAAGRPG